MCLHRENLHPVSGGITFRTETKRNTWEDRGKSCQSRGSERPPAPDPGVRPGPTNTFEPASRKTPSFQELGTIKLPEGRMVTYPNTLQHKFEVPILEEPSRSGYIQLLQLHLVDPHYIVCSTRFVPPQNLEWWKEAIDYQRICRMSRIPPEISNMIIECLLVPEKLLNRRKRVRGLQHYWRSTSMWLDSSQPRQPPIRYESALRIEKHALQHHERVLRAVNSEKMYDQAGALTVWIRTVLRGATPVDDRDPRDLFAILSSETEDEDADVIGKDAANDIPDVEARYMRDFDIPLSVAVSSASAGSTDGGELPARSRGSGNSSGLVNGDDEDGDGGSDEAPSSEGAVNATEVQDGDVGEDEDDNDNYVDAVPGFTLAELAEIQAQEQSTPPEELELYEDATSQADETEPDIMEQ
ncbi:hypothetical protein A9K55_007703 [Cordyceps militaris]|uniref:DUF4246 domain-containing protein n=1 Tax=Cordyceps militaris TaxID=73501 RepID=A0A2H4SI34_CORMI|nr:hypothetical protein A9K55_007703 [Cordyceps militaris]